MKEEKEQMKKKVVSSQEMWRVTYRKPLPVPGVPGVAPQTLMERPSAQARFRVGITKLFSRNETVKYITKYVSPVAHGPT